MSSNASFSVVVSDCGKYFSCRAAHGAPGVEDGKPIEPPLQTIRCKRGCRLAFQDADQLALHLVAVILVVVQRLSTRHTTTYRDDMSATEKFCEGSAYATDGASV